MNQENNNMSTSKELANLLTRVQKLPAAITALDEQVRAVDERMRVLKKAGLIYAAGHWRAGKYFMLVHPQKNGVRPSPTYIGTDEKKILEAQQGIERAKEYDQLAQVAQKLARKASEARDALSQLERTLILR
jgi:hypothetical protein